MMTEKGKQLYDATYQSMAGRVEEDGYANTSLTGTYGGMFCRDTAAHILCHTRLGDYDLAFKMLRYTFDYHKQHNFDFVIHVMDKSHRQPDMKKQSDATFLLLYAWVAFAKAAPKTDEVTAFLADSYPLVCTFANHYLDGWEFNPAYGLIFNESLEHSRDRSYFQCYDMLTNVCASQAFHDLSAYVKETDPAHAKKWGNAADTIAKGIHNFLVPTVDGKKFYGELIGTSQKNLDKNPNASILHIRGFSWVNIAAMSVDWYAADPEILENTHQLYMQYADCLYYDKYKMPDCYTEFETTLAPAQSGHYVLGKALAWEMLYCHKTGKNDRIRDIMTFIEDRSSEIYMETYEYTGGGSDGGNQEQAAWLLYAIYTISHWE